jgi:toxin YoeB
MLLCAGFLVSWQGGSIVFFATGITGNTICGIGKPEPLRNELSGWWSKRIDDEHRLVYKTEGDALIIAQAQGHYD